MHRTRVPQNEISRTGADLEKLTSPILKPLRFRIFEPEPITWAPGLSTRYVMVLEKLLIQRVRTFQDYQATIIRSIRREIQDTLDALQADPGRRLINMWPGLCRFL